MTVTSFYFIFLTCFQIHSVYEELEQPVADFAALKLREVIK